MISFHDSRLRLTSGSEEIGDWERSRYQLSRTATGTFVLSAEGDDLPFRPTRPDEFALAATRGMAAVPDANSRRKKRHTPDAADTSEQAPPAKPPTLVLFYLLVAGTVGMAVWALLSIIG